MSRRFSWIVLQPSSKLAGKDALSLLGRVVADIQNPTKDYEPPDSTSLSEQLGELVTVSDTDVKNVVLFAPSEDAKLQLTDFFGLEHSRRSAEGQSVAAKTVITRTIRQDRRYFTALKKEHEQGIIKLMKENEGMKEAYLVVGVRTSIDADFISLSQVENRSEGHANVPVDEIVAASTGVLLPISLKLGISLERARIRFALQSYRAEGERLFAIQYRRVKRKRDIKLRDTIHYGDLKRVDNWGMYRGDSSTENDNEEHSSEDVGVEENDDDLVLEDGIEGFCSE